MMLIQRRLFRCVLMQPVITLTVNPIPVVHIKKTNFFYKNEQEEAGETIGCAGKKVWHKSGYIYMIEEKNYSDWSEATLVRYDKYGNNKEKISLLNSEYELFGLWGNADIGVTVIGDYLYYVKSIKAGNLGREYIYPEYTDSIAALYLGNYDNFVAQVKRCECYVSLYRVALSGGSNPEKLSDDIFFYGWGSDTLEFIKKSVLIGGNDEDGITMAVSTLGATPNMDGSYYFEPKCQVYTYKPGDTGVVKVKEFGLKDEMFTGEVRWQRSSPYVDDYGRLIFATGTSLDGIAETYRMYAYSAKSNSCQSFFERNAKKSVRADGLVQVSYVTREDDEYIYIYESSDEYFYINVFNKQLDMVDTLNVKCSSYDSFLARKIGAIAYDKNYLIMGVSDGFVTINTTEENISVDKNVINIWESSDEEENAWAMGGTSGYAYTFVVDKTCIGTGELKAFKLMEYPYAGYKY